MRAHTRAHTHAHKVAMVMYEYLDNAPPLLYLIPGGGELPWQHFCYNLILAAALHNVHEKYTLIGLKYHLMFIANSIQ